MSCRQNAGQNYVEKIAIKTKKKRQLSKIQSKDSYQNYKVKIAIKTKK